MFCGIDNQITNSIKLIFDFDAGLDYWLKAYLLDVNILDNDYLYNNAFNSLPDFRKSEANKFKFLKDKKLSIGAWLVLTFALNNCDIKNFENSFNVNKNGKPYILNSGTNQCFFNLSHSGNYALCVVSNKEIGCDIQKQDHIDARLIDSCMNSDELGSFVDTVYTHWDKEPFYRLWTLKESFMKMTSYGLSINPIDVQFVKIDNVTRCYEYKFCNNSEHKIPNHANFIEVNAPDNYNISICISD